MATPTTVPPPASTPTATVSSTGVTSALSTSGATLTTALAAAYPGIQVSNPAVTAQGLVFHLLEVLQYCPNLLPLRTQSHPTSAPSPLLFLFYH